VALVATLLACGVVVLILALRDLGGGPAIAEPTGTSSGPSGPKATGPTIVGGDEEARYLAPYLGGGEGWYSWMSPPVPAGDGSVAWASTTPIVERDLSLGAAIPPETIASLPASGVVVTVETLTSSFDPSLGPFPYDASNLQLRAATIRGPEAEEPPGEYAVYELDDPAVLVRVYFGTAHPAEALVDAAQRELDTLQLPPTCPFPGPGGYRVRLSAAEGEPGDAVTITGLMPFQREDGSYDASGDTMMIAWWNASPEDWSSLSSFSEVPRSPAISDLPLLRLGEDGGNVCAFSIRFTVPDVPLGKYPIVVLQEGGGGSAIEGSLEFRVSPGG
jgi:hypothetical protein